VFGCGSLLRKNADGEAPGDSLLDRVRIAPTEKRGI
jgi:hypothetical protein